MHQKFRIRGTSIRDRGISVEYVKTWHFSFLAYQFPFFFCTPMPTLCANRKRYECINNMTLFEQAHSAPLLPRPLLPVPVMCYVLLLFWSHTFWMDFLFLRCCVHVCRCVYLFSDLSNVAYISHRPHIMLVKSSFVDCVRDARRKGEREPRNGSSRQRGGIEREKCSPATTGMNAHTNCVLYRWTDLLNYSLKL